MNVEKRQEIERKVVRHLIRTMKARGWIVSRINDGGEPDEDTLDPNETEAMDTVFSVDESVIYFHKKLDKAVSGIDGMTHWAQIILGNDGWDCIADHSYSENPKPGDDFKEVMEQEVDPYVEKQESENS